ncbi:2-amino-4-hydroxy-6-hydroxymethyldihydropteridine diphosphokinase [Spirochaetia bacterium 38H-sp]|uniref:2-amino-4-hydroxy-6-hydroxymethyldihydropteridine pyrophosphokinase n=1 Tax=Rarispira pelagica TaxID=3141764 RepID=A0ABU9UAN9_9SPIR
MPQSFLSLGSNQGDKEKNIKSAINDLSASVEILAVSKAYITQPLYYHNQEDFLNLALKIETTLPPEKLLNTINKIEKKYGRDREKEQRYGPRPLDIDIILYDNIIIDTPHLKIPHPRLYERAFVLIPLLELDPKLTCPKTKKPLRTYLDSIDQSNWTKTPKGLTLF